VSLADVAAGRHLVGGRQSAIARGLPLVDVVLEDLRIPFDTHVLDERGFST
jgi:hypothetical protein